MRKSVESLCGIVRTSHMNPLNGDAHVFFPANHAAWFTYSTLS